MEENWEPFELVQDEQGTTLRLHGTEEKRKKVAADKIPKLYKAMREGRDIDIQYAVIDGAINIKQAGLDTNNQGKYIIAGKIIVGNNVMRGIVNFDEAIFERPVHFAGSIFEQNASFVARFKQSGCFNKAHFVKDVSFSGATFICDADFMGTVFCQGAFFSRTRFELPARFIGAEFKKRMCFVRVDMEHPASFERAHVNENTVFACLYRRLRGKETATNVYEINTTLVMDTSSNPRLKRYIDDEQWISSWRYSSKLRRFFFYPLWRGMADCGRSVILWGGWSVLFAFIFACVYLAFGCESIAFNVEQLAGQQPDFWAYLYHSVVTFTTLGFGDIVPLTNPARLAVGAEVVLGYVMLGGLISIFANKFARRS